MATWNSRGLRGSTLEEMVNRTNEWYLEKGLALIQKIPTPITPVKMDKEHRQITLAYFDQRSTVDYIGAVQGIPVCFDAKECVAQTFPLQNIHEHQVRFMEDLLFCKRYALLSPVPGIIRFLETGGRRRQEKLPDGRTGSQVFYGVFQRILYPLSGCAESGS